MYTLNLDVRQPHGLHPHKLRAITGHASVRPKETRTTQQTHRKTKTLPHQFDWNPLVSFGPQYEDKYIATLDPTLELIQIQKSQKTRVLLEVQADILYCHLGYFTPSPAISCASRNYGPRALMAKN